MVVVFRSRLRPDVDVEAYGRRVEEILEHARAMPGFVSIRDYAAEDGERCAVVEFASESELDAWRRHAEHRLAQEEGRERFYSEYHLQVCRRVRESRFSREPAGPPPRPGTA